MCDNDMTHFVKVHGPTVFDDWLAANTLFSACQKVAGIHAPEPLSLDIESQSISYRRLHNITPFIDRCGDIEIAKKAGHLIAKLHKHGCIPTTEIESTALAWLQSAGASTRDIESIQAHTTPGFLHRDCWHGNLF